MSMLVVTLLATMLSQSAPAWARYASLVVDGESGVVLYSRSADTLKYPASLTKIMTLYMVFDALKSGKWVLNTRLKVSRRASRQPQTRLGLKVGYPFGERRCHRGGREPSGYRIAIRRKYDQTGSKVGDVAHHVPQRVGATGQKAAQHRP
jgi:hypothetical protein